MARNDENSPAERRAKLGKPPQPGRCCGAVDADGPRSGPQPNAAPTGRRPGVRLGNTAWTTSRRGRATSPSPCRSTLVWTQGQPAACGRRA